MHILTDSESRIYEFIRNGIQPKDIMKLPDYNKISSVYTIVQRLTDLGYLEKDLEKKYTPLVTEYRIVENKGLRLLSRNRHVIKPMNSNTTDEPYENIKVTEDQRKLILDLRVSGKRTSVISRVLGLPRYVINKEIILLGIRQQ